MTAQPTAAATLVARDLVAHQDSHPRGWQQGVGMPPGLLQL